jgi:hypothetical protein
MSERGKVDWIVIACAIAALGLLFVTIAFLSMAPAR